MRIAIIVIVLLALSITASSFYVVDQTQFAVQMRLGKPVRTLVQPGLYVKYPWPIDRVVRFDNRLMVLENPREDEPDREYLTQDDQSGIGKNVVVSTYTCWRIKRDRDSVLRFLESMGDIESANQRIGDTIVSELGAALGQRDFSVLISTDEKERDWTGVLNGIRESCAKKVESYGVELIDVRIDRLNFPEQNRRSVFDRMRSERDVIATRYRSEGDQEASAIRSAAEKKRAEILAKAAEADERIRGQADAEAARIYNEAYGRDPEFYRFLRTLETYESLKQGTVAILSADSQFLRLLNRHEDFKLAVPPVTPTNDTGKPADDDNHASQASAGVPERSTATDKTKAMTIGDDRD